MSPTRHFRGFAFVTTLWVIIVLTALVLAMGYTVRVEAVAAANRTALAQADAAERGVEQFLLAAVESEVATPGATATISMEDIPVGDCHAWVLKPNPDDEQTALYGLTDEAGKLDLNEASASALELLPGMTQDSAASIINWRGRGMAVGGLGASDSYYQSLPNPYDCKHAPFETVEELMLLKDVDASLMFGNDRNRSGTLEGREIQGGGTVTLFSNASGTGRGMFPFVTVYGVIAAKTPPAPASTTTTPRAVTVNQDPAALGKPDNPLRKALTTALGDSVAQRIIDQMPKPPAPAPNYTSTFQWAVEVRLTSAEYSKVIHLVNATAAGGGGGGAGGGGAGGGGAGGGGAGGGAAAAAPATAKINVNTAASQVLVCLPSLTQSDADAIVAHRQQDPTPADPGDISWMLDVIGDRGKRLAIANDITGTSCCFSGDIVAASGDGRAFKRVRVVIDGSTGTPKIIYRRDLTSSGWPLPADVRVELRSGRATSGGAAGGSPLLPGKGGTAQ